MKRLIASTMTALATQLSAQSVTCLPRDALVESLRNTHGEHLTGGGLQNAARMIEVWTSDTTGSFTVFVTRTDGIACIVATGTNWHSTVRQDPKT